MTRAILAKTQLQLSKTGQFDPAAEPGQLWRPKNEALRSREYLLPDESERSKSARSRVPSRWLLLGYLSHLFNSHFHDLSNVFEAESLTHELANHLEFRLALKILVDSGFL